MREDEFECAVTGMMSGEIPEELDDGGPPPEWTQIAFLKRKFNPRWMLIQQVKKGMLEDLLQQYPPEHRGVQQQIIGVQIDATFRALEEATPVFVTEIEDGAVVSDKPEAVEVLNEIRALLGMTEMPVDPAKEQPKEPPAGGEK